MKYEYIKNAMDGRFTDIQKNVLDIEDVRENTRLILFNTASLSELIYNSNCKAHGIAFNALKMLISDRVREDFNISDVPTTKQVEKYFNEYGFDYKDVLIPLLDEIVDDRKNN